MKSQAYNSPNFVKRLEEDKEKIVWFSPLSKILQRNRWLLIPSKMSGNYCTVHELSSNSSTAMSCATTFQSIMDCIDYGDPIMASGVSEMSTRLSWARMRFTHLHFSNGTGQCNWECSGGNCQAHQATFRPSFIASSIV